MTLTTEQATKLKELIETLWAESRDVNHAMAESVTKEFPIPHIKEIPADTARAFANLLAATNQRSFGLGVMATVATMMTTVAFLGEALVDDPKPTVN